ncbi:thioredoxin domain-containing protein 5 homolog [Plodia interpunctella]|uniref:thioredoxin domain-containing protein 5 homolog n=1 Tax=Plodia interpunctella TaxID=58824 RepID=UPI002367FDF9|nr:thioredoxin domain-containing protein 5 homolog [Plodia interpunctella]
MRNKVLNKLAPICFLFLPYFVAPEENKVYEYDSNNFKQRIEEMDGNFILFYAPWCSHCTSFYPIWQELAELVNSKGSKFAIAQVDCTMHPKLCNDNDITGYPTLLYFHKNTFTPVEFQGTRDLPSLTLFLSDVFTLKLEEIKKKDQNEIKIYSGMAHLNDQNIEKFVSKGQHFIMFYAPWCQASQKLAPLWAELAVQYSHNEYIQIGKVNCMENDMTCKNFDIKQYPHLLWIANGRIMGVANMEHKNVEDLKAYVQKMLLAENHDPEKFMKKKKALPVARISEETFETFIEKDLVFINYFAPWCAHCMQLNPLWLKLGERFQNETRVLIADVDCVRSKPICDTEKINSLPTLILYKHKKIIQVEHGGRPLESLISLVNEQLEGTSSPDTAADVSSEEQSTPAKDEL